jgi:uncharacterized protein DUF781
VAPDAAHPSELADLDLFEVWTGAEQLAGCFDPFRFDHRMAAYRLLIGTINRDGRFGVDNRRNPLWGLMFQHQWQFRTGRLGTETRQDGRIDPDAPWGYGNYALCVIPWLGAVAAGAVPELAVAPPPGPSRFSYASGGGTEPLRVPAEFQPGVEDWKAFFLLVEATPAGADDEPVRLALWKAHKTCLDVIADRISGIDPAPWSPLELTFLRGWCRMVDYLWVAAWPTDFDFMTTHGMDVLPERLLTGDDLRAGGDLPDRVMGNLRAVLGLARMPEWRYRVNLAAWKRVMRTRPARDEVVPLLDAVFSPNPDPAARRRMLRYLLRP